MLDAIEKTLTDAIALWGRDSTTEIITVRLLRRYTDNGGTAERCLEAIAKALSEQGERVTMRDFERFRAVFIGIRTGESNRE